MRAEHWILLAGLLSLMGGLEPNVEAWSDLLQVQTVLKFSGAAALMIRASLVAPH